MKTRTREIVAALIISKDNKILMGKKDPQAGGVYNDCWHIPGGGVEEHESFEEALRREVLDEVGINISHLPIALLDDTDTGTSLKVDKKSREQYICNMKFHTYKVMLLTDADETDIQVSDDLVETKWIKKEDLHLLQLTPPSIKLFTKIGFIKA